MSRQVTETMPATATLGQIGPRTAATVRMAEGTWEMKIRVPGRGSSIILVIHWMNPLVRVGFAY
jgi:hypothetical protein